MISIMYPQTLGVCIKMQIILTAKYMMNSTFLHANNNKNIQCMAINCKIKMFYRFFGFHVMVLMQHDGTCASDQHCSH